MAVDASKHYFATFRLRQGHTFRIDTRVYLQPRERVADSDYCIAAVVGKNPGSAKPSKHGRHTPIELDGDQCLPTVRKRFVDAYEDAGVEIPRNGFIRVCNLMYLCDPQLTTALRTFGTIRKPVWCDREDAPPPIVWFVWGPPTKQLDPLKARFLEREYEHAFWFDISTRKIVKSVPDAASRVKHTQGMPRDQVHRHLVRWLRRR